MVHIVAALAAVALCSLLLQVASANGGNFVSVGVSGIQKTSTSFPPALDWAPGICTGYAYCVPGNIPPTYAPAEPACPDDYDMDEDGRCVQMQASCPPATSKNGEQCCYTKSTNSCFASLESSCPAGCSGGSSICSPSQPYLDVVSQVSVVQVTTNKEAASGTAFFKLGMPKFDLVKGAIIDKVLSEKIVSVPVSTLKTVNLPPEKLVIPKCFLKCCKPAQELVCMPPRLKQVYTIPTVTCPPGCTRPTNGQCTCNPGGPAPCPSGTTDCNSQMGGRLCASDNQVFGIDSCKIVQAFRTNLPQVACPSEDTTTVTTQVSISN